MSIPAVVEAWMKPRRWIMNNDLFNVIAQDAELIAAMQGRIMYVHAGVGEAFGTRRVQSHIRRDLAQIQELVDTGELGPGDNVVYAIEDPQDETTPDTPLEQIRNLPDSIRSARGICNSVGAALIAAPANSVIPVYAPDYTGSPKDGILALDIPEMCAEYADVYEIQAQQSEQNPDAYASYVAECKRKARTVAVKPILAGLTTNSPRSRPDDYPTAAEIYNAARAVAGIVEGYWLNVPEHRVTDVRDFDMAHEFLRLFHRLTP